MEDIKLCAYCQAPAQEENEFSVPLCKECTEAYDDKTGYCSLECCISGNCDGSC